MSKDEAGGEGVGKGVEFQVGTRTSMAAWVCLMPVTTYYLLFCSFPPRIFWDEGG